MTTLPDLITTLRARSGLPRAQWAESLGVGETMTYSMETSGKSYSRRPSATLLVRMLDLGQATEDERAASLRLLAEAERSFQSPASGQDAPTTL